MFIDLALDGQSINAGSSTTTIGIGISANDLDSVFGNFINVGANNFTVNGPTNGISLAGTLSSSITVGNGWTGGVASFVWDGSNGRATCESTLGSTRANLGEPLLALGLVALGLEPLFDVAEPVAHVAADAVADGSSMGVAPLVDRGGRHVEVGGEFGDAEQPVDRLARRGGLTVIAASLELVGEESSDGVASCRAEVSGEGVERGSLGGRQHHGEGASTVVASHEPLQDSATGALRASWSRWCW